MDYPSSLALLGVGRHSDAERLREFLDDHIPTGAETIFYHRPHRPQSVGDYLRAFLKNPTVTLFLPVLAAFNRLRSLLKHRSRTPAADAAVDQLAAARNLQVVDVGTPITDVIRREGWSWTVLSWLVLVGILTPFLETSSGSISVLFGGIITAYIFSYPFFRTTAPGRTQDMVHRMKEKSEKERLEHTCLLADRDHVPHLEKVADVLGVRHSSAVLPSLTERIRTRLR